MTGTPPPPPTSSAASLWEMSTSMGQTLGWLERGRLIVFPALNALLWQTPAAQNWGTICVSNIDVTIAKSIAATHNFCIVDNLDAATFILSSSTIPKTLIFKGPMPCVVSDAEQMTHIEWYHVQIEDDLKKAPNQLYNVIDALYEAHPTACISLVFGLTPLQLIKIPTRAEFEKERASVNQKPEPERDGLLYGSENISHDSPISKST